MELCLFCIKNLYHEEEIFWKYLQWFFSCMFHACFCNTQVHANTWYKDLSVSAWNCIFFMSVVLMTAWWHHQMEAFLCYWPFVWGIHQWQAHKGQWCRALMFSLICTWTKSWAKNQDMGDLRCHCAHYDVTVMDCGLLHINPTLRCTI